MYLTVKMSLPYALYRQLTSKIKNVMANYVLYLESSKEQHNYAWCMVEPNMSFSHFTSNVLFAYAYS